jgi:hypothetical protein
VYQLAKSGQWFKRTRYRGEECLQKYIKERQALYLIVGYRAVKNACMTEGMEQ